VSEFAILSKTPLTRRAT